MLMGKAGIDITDKARHDKIASLVERILALTPSYPPERGKAKVRARRGMRKA